LQSGLKKAVKLGGKPKEVSNWIMGELLRLLNEENKDITQCSVKPSQLVELIRLIEKEQ